MRVFGLIVILTILSCNHQATKKTTMYKANVAELATILNLKLSPDSVRFEVITQNDFFNEQTIIASLNYCDSSLNTILDEALFLDTQIDFIDIRVKREWLPEAIKDQFLIKDSDSTNYTIKCKAYDINYFSNNGFNSGFFFVTDNTVFVYAYSH